MDLVSIILPVYNAELFVHEAIDSVLKQTYNHFELIVIDDCSQDKSSEILKKFQESDLRIIIHQNHQNLGVVKSLNIGLDLARGKFIARIDADDIWFPDKLRKQIQYLEKHENILMLATSKLNMNEDGSVRNNDIYPRIYTYQDICKNILKRNIFCHSSVVFHKKVIDHIGKYNESFINSEDYEYWIRIISQGEVEILEEPLVYYRISKHTVSYKRLREQRYYALLAKIRGIKLLNKSWLNIFYVAEDLIYVIIPNFIFNLWRRYKSWTN